MRNIPAIKRSLPVKNQQATNGIRNELNKLGATPRKKFIGCPKLYIGLMPNFISQMSNVPAITINLLMRLNSILLKIDKLSSETNWFKSYLTNVKLSLPAPCSIQIPKQ
jgi:hypothetical protein